MNKAKTRDTAEVDIVSILSCGDATRSIGRRDYHVDPGQQIFSDGQQIFSDGQQIFSDRQQFFSDRQQFFSDRQQFFLTAIWYLF